MNNYKIIVEFTDVEYNKEDMNKIMSNFIAFNGYLYSLDYHGYANGANWTENTDKHILTIIVNGDKFWEGPDDIIKEIRDIIKRKQYKINKWNTTVLRSENEIEIPEGYIEQYYANSYSL